MTQNDRMTVNTFRDIKTAVAFINLVMQKSCDDHIDILTPIHGHVNTPWYTVLFSR
jgi:hypothetical protein